MTVRKIVAKKIIIRDRPPSKEYVGSYSAPCISTWCSPVGSDGLRATAPFEDVELPSSRALFADVCTIEERAACNAG